MTINESGDTNSKPKPSKEDLIKSALEDGVVPSDEDIDEVVWESRLDNLHAEYERTGGPPKFIDLDIKPEERFSIKSEVTSALEEKQLDSVTAAAQRKIRKPLRM